MDNTPARYAWDESAPPPMGTLPGPIYLLRRHAAQGRSRPRLPAAPAADTREVLNYVRAMERGPELLRTIPVSLRLVPDLHAVLLEGVRGEQDRPGEFRTVQNYIGSQHAPITEARFVPPPVTEMREALDLWEWDLHLQPEPLPLLVRLAVSHDQFEAIHPFRDARRGVGKCGRERP